MKSLVKLTNISKVFPKDVAGKGNFGSMWRILFGRKTVEGSQVLHDIDLEIERGQSLAIIGTNGAGKSTLLKIISGVIQATDGDMKVNASIGALLELGSGFDPEYSGFENLKLAAALAGIPNKDVSEKIDRMIAFADIGESIHEPVKHYSSGMVVRLGFSVITVTQPDLLITDEVLAVGDEKFQRKCIRWIDSYLSNGGTLLLVSHSMYHVQKICNQAIWLENGTIKMRGDAYQVSQAYQSQFDMTQNKGGQSGHINPNNYHIVDFDVLDHNSVSVSSVESGHDLTVEVNMYSPDGQMPGVAVGVIRSDEVPVFGTFSDLNEGKAETVDAHHFRYRIHFPKINLLPGLYQFRVHTMDPKHVQLIDTCEKEIRIMGKTREIGVTRLRSEWH
ncbi:polysaccharide ABC transporter ATP-binding protein [Marinicella sp. W31]|uniref:ABC transporter ATP-binding protein n=1 Tax=Marinicella sp. W31 TaxID=3023713 RepID=UPI00375632B1